MKNQIIGYTLVNEKVVSDRDAYEEVLAPIDEKSFLDSLKSFFYKYRDAVVGKSPRKIAEMIFEKTKGIKLSNKTKAQIITMIIAINCGAATIKNINEPKIKEQPKYIEIERIVDEVMLTGNYSLEGLAESSGIKRQDILDRNGFNSESAAVGQYAKVPYKIEKGDNYFFYKISAQKDVYSRLDLARIADEHEISLETLLDINAGNYTHDEKGYHFKYGTILVTVFPSKNAQTFLRTGK